MKIQVIVGSTRPNRFGLTAGQWFLDQAKQAAVEGVDFELIDLQQINLPMFDEPQSPAMGQYANQHTKDWAATVGQADGYIFVTSEYNHSYPASLKNAIDYLYAEWNWKPVGFVSYGAGEGGARAVEHLRGVAAQLKMFDLPEFVTIPNYWNQLGDSGFVPTEQQAQAAKDLANSIAFWASQMAKSRATLSQKR